jgi:hypothetical protein
MILRRSGPASACAALLAVQSRTCANQGTGVAERPAGFQLARLPGAPPNGQAGATALATARACFAELRERARRLARQPAAQAHPIQLRAALVHLSHDEYRKLGFRPEHSRGRGAPGAFRGPVEAEQLQLVPSSTGGHLLEQDVEKNAFAARLLRGAKRACCTSCRAARLLRSKSDALTETWSYLWQPKQ